VSPENTIRNYLLAGVAALALLCSCSHGRGQLFSGTAAPPPSPAYSWSQATSSAQYLFPVKMRPQQPVAGGGKIALAAPAELSALLPPPSARRAAQEAVEADDETPAAPVEVAGKLTLTRRGADYEPALPAAGVVRRGYRALFRPQSGEPAYAVYRFALAGYSGEPTLKLEWDLQPTDWSHLWIAFADFVSNTWKWYRGPDDFVLTLHSYATYTSERSGDCLCAVLVLDEEEAVLAGLTVGASELRATGDLSLLSWLPVAPPGSLEAEAGLLLLPLPPEKKAVTAVDLSPGCAPIDDQKHWAACTAFAVGNGALNYELKRLYGADGWDLKNPFHRVSCKYLYIISGQLQGWPSGPYYYRYTGDVVWDLKEHGVASELNAPYDLVYSCNWSPEALADAELLCIEDCGYLRPLSEADLQELRQVLAEERRPVVMRVELDNGFFGYEAGEVWTFAGPKQGGHAMCIVGYDDSLQAFKVRNSWGPNWGDAGHVWISYATFLNPDAYVACWTLKNEYDPTVAHRFLGPLVLLPAPQGVQASDGTEPFCVRLAWMPTPGATGYLVYRDSRDNRQAELGQVAEWTDHGLHDFLPHTYWVQARDGKHLSYLSTPDTGYAARGHP